MRSTASRVVVLPKGSLDKARSVMVASRTALPCAAWNEAMSPFLQRAEAHPEGEADCRLCSLSAMRMVTAVTRPTISASCG